MNEGSEPISETIRVFVRQRPILNQDSDKHSLDIRDVNNTSCSRINSISKDKKSCQYYHLPAKTSFNFGMDYFFDESSTQEEVFETVALPIIKSSLKGYSGTIMAYGPTSSGKTFTMRGFEGNYQGIIPRCLNTLLQSLGNEISEIWCSYLQIYCEKVTDLLSYSDETQSLSLRERNGNVFVEGLTKQPIKSVEELNAILLKGDESRITAATNLNETSSRSHAALILTIRLREQTTQQEPSGVVSYTESKLVLLDLAGSERAFASEGRDYIRSDEAKAINLSLSALGNCMNALAEIKPFIPYRDSKLTRLLQNSIGGSSRTAVLVNIPSGEDPVGEMLNALKFATRASKVKVFAKIKRVKDYETLYNEMKQKFDAFDSSHLKTNQPSTENSKGSFDQLSKELQTKNELIDQLRNELDLVRSKYQVLEDNQKVLMMSSHPITSSATAREVSLTKTTDETVDIKEILRQHSQTIDEINNNYQEKIKRMQRNQESMRCELSELQDDLKKERENHLGTVTSLRTLQEKKVKNELQLKSRIEELLLELSDTRNAMDDYKQKSMEYTDKWLQTENQLNATIQKMSDEMISIHQVKEMERLFLDTVSKLTLRVNQLESQKGHPVPVAGRSNKESISSVEMRHVGTMNHRMEPGGRIRPSSIGNSSNLLHSNSQMEFDKSK